MTGAHDEKVIERALNLVAAYCAGRGTVIERNNPRPATPEEIKTFFIDWAYEELGYIKDPLGRWCKP